MKNLFSFVVLGTSLVFGMAPVQARAELRCDSLFSNSIVDVTIFATHLSPGTNRKWSPFRFEFSPGAFTIRVLGNFAESTEGAKHFPPAVFAAPNPSAVAVHPANRLVAVLSRDSGVYAFADGVVPNQQGWRRIDQASGREKEGLVFLVYEIELSTKRPHFGFFKVYVTDGPNLRELGTVVPNFVDRKVEYPSDAGSVRLISPTRIEITSFVRRTVRQFEIEPPTPASEQGLELSGFR